MRKFFLFSAFILMTTGANLAAQQRDSIKTKELEEIVVSATRAGVNTPVTYTNVSAETIRKNNAANNLPMVLQTLPSLVAFTEGGTGVGNTSFRIRGTDATRINVTFNGMPLNNPESQEVYWVNLPDLSSSLQSVQLQRGIGTSTNGGAAFGASLSLKTLGGQPQAYGEASTAVGSYNTFSSNIAAGTGILSNGLSVDARYSRVFSDGYIRNGKVDHQNFYAALSYYTDKQLLRLLYMRGEQHTGITWEGVSAKQMQDKEYGRRYNPAGEYVDEAGNRLYYDNETDNYYSDIVQLLFTRELTSSLSLNAGLSWNHGYGYYEDYKKYDPIYGKKFEYYGLPDQILGSVTHKRSDMIRQQLMLNNLYVANVAVDYRKNALKWTSGAMFSFYDGEHYGTIPWVKFNQNIENNYEWYRNNSKKSELNFFTKAEYQLTEQFSFFADMQFRHILYKFSGIDKDRRDPRKMEGELPYNFFNPKAGVFYRLTDMHSLYASVAVGQREPLRADLKDAVKGGANKAILPELMIDYELGYRFQHTNGITAGANFYFMDYNNQMVQTGKLSDVGYKLMENVKDSYRAGIELEASVPLWENKVRLDANATFSQNKIKNYTAYFDVYDNPIDYNEVYVNGDKTKGQLQTTKELTSTNISFSPDVVSALSVTYQPISRFYLNLLGKYVGKQFLDNTSDDAKAIDSYFVSDFSAGYTLPKISMGTISLQIMVNNIFSKEYIANGWASTDAFSNGSTINYIGYYPQATRNFMARLTLKF